MSQQVCHPVAKFVAIDRKTGVLLCASCRKLREAAGGSVVRLPKITAKQEGGDDGYCYVVRVDGREFVNGLTRSEVDGYKRAALRAWIARVTEGDAVLRRGLLETTPIASTIEVIEDNTRGIKIGDTVRLYAYPGTFVVDDLKKPAGSTSTHDFFAIPSGKTLMQGFGASYRSVVELNGKPMPLMSAPLAPPASDYPHEPTFDYDDGPQELGEDALEIWRDRGQRAHDEANAEEAARTATPGTPTEAF